MRHRSRHRLLTLLVLAVCAAGAIVSTVVAHPRSGVYGVAMRGPTRPACPAELPCDAPAANTTLIFTRHGISSRVTTRSNGSYSVALTPGRYRVRVDAKTASGRLRPNRVRVPRGRFAHVNFAIDTGIR